MPPDPVDYHPHAGHAPSGLACCGDMRWGAHVCHFYENREDLVDVLVPFFATGLANGEKCLWVTSEPLGAADAAAALAGEVPDVAHYLASGQLEVVDYERWYAGRHPDAVLRAWIDAEARALADGYAGLRLTGNVTFIKSRDEWRAFQRYERRVNELFATRRIIALCSYHLGSTSSVDVLDVVGSHRFALARRDGAWETVESAALRHATLVALSGWGSGEHRERRRAAGIDHHLTKPVAIARLQTILDALQPAATPAA